MKHATNPRSLVRVIVALGITLLLAACIVGPHYHSPAAPSLTKYTPDPQPTRTVVGEGPAGTAQKFDPAMEIPAQWWTMFRSPELDRMVREALKKSATLEQATARLKEAQEELSARTGALKRPTVTGNAAVQGEKVNLEAFGVPFPNPPPFSLLNGSVAVTYALDFFGANRRLIEGLNAQADYQGWQLQGARLMLAGNVVAAAIRQAQLRSEIATSKQMLQIQERELQITRRLNEAGGVSQYDVHVQQTALAQTQATLPPLELQLDVVNHQLGVLMGQAPADGHVESISLESLHLPERLPLSLPSSLVRQRPDIRAAESLLHQAGANVGVATANLYPQIVLSGNFGASGTSFTQGAGVWNAGASLAQPIYNGGALRAERRKALASYQEADGVYRETVLQAFREVPDALRAIEHDAETQQARAEAATQAQAAYDIAAHRLSAGGISQLALLGAERQQLQTALDQIQSAAGRYADSATLLQSLGGGWWNETAPVSTFRSGNPSVREAAPAREAAGPDVKPLW